MTSEAACDVDTYEDDWKHL